MKTLRNKISAITIAIFFILSMTASTMLIPNANAHTPPWTIPTYCFVSASPNPVGVGQACEIVFWNSIVLPTSNGAYGDRWQNIYVHIISPDGTNTTLGPFTGDPEGGGYVLFTPNVVGNYTIQSIYSTQVLAGANPPPVPNSYSTSPYINDTFLGAVSPTVTLVVQTQPVSVWTPAPLPTSYWSVPVTAENRLWSTLIGDWLAGASYDMASKYQPYGLAPTTAHILWTKPITFGGESGNQFGGSGSYYNGYTYEAMWSPPIIIQNYLYYNVLKPPEYGWICVNMETGQTVWTQNSTGPIQASGIAYQQLSFGQILNYDSPNQWGEQAYLWSTYTNSQGQSVWAMYDAFTGNWICNIVGVPSGTAAVDSNGDILRYVVNTQAGWIAEWNSTLCILNTSPSNITANGYWEWRPPLGQSVSAATGYSWNITLPSQVPKNAYVVGYDEANQIMLLSTGLPTFSIGNPQFPTLATYTDMAISLNPSTLGQLQWIDQRQWPPGNVTLAVAGSGAVADADAYTVFVKETRQWYAYNLTTGDLMWGPSASESQWDMYLAGSPESATAYNTLYTCGFGGTLYAYDLTTGNLEWTFYSGNSSLGNSGFNTPYGQYPIWIGAIGDGMIYVYGSDHANGASPWLGAQEYCINVTNGQLLWSLDGWFGNAAGGGGNVAISDGMIADLNTYNNEIYCIGKGLSATTVTTSPCINNPDQVLITGTVTDQSPGQTCLGIPAAGTPAISDASMSAWMEYLYEQQPEPMNATGVPVTLSYIDPNGNYYTLGNTTSDINGQYTDTFTPTIPGTYTITTTFDGTNSYYSSTAETHLNFSPAATTTAAPTATPTSVADMYFVPAIAALFVLIIVVAIVLALLMLRKKP